MAAALIFMVPSLWLHATTPLIIPTNARPAQAALIFGAVVRDGAISPLQKERLDAGLALYRQGAVPRVVVSNTAHAAKVMATYLSSQGLPAEAISLDTQAERSPDTCAEAARQELTRVIFVSQRFHLPRLRLHCRRYGLEAQYVMADSPQRAPVSVVTKMQVRAGRFLRETVLIWGTMLGFYPHQTAPKPTARLG